MAGVVAELCIVEVIVFDLVVPLVHSQARHLFLRPASSVVKVLTIPRV